MSDARTGAEQGRRFAKQTARIRPVQEPTELALSRGGKINESSDLRTGAAATRTAGH
jgi:hypothetical protein